MGGPVRSGQSWEVVNRVLVRQFLGRSTAVLLLLVCAIGFLRHDVRPILGALVGGGWMIANCLTLAWMGGQALRPGQRHAQRFLVGLLAVVCGLVACMMWLVLAWRPSLAGLSAGLALPLLLLLFQLRQLNRTLQSHAR